MLHLSHVPYTPMSCAAADHPCRAHKDGACLVCNRGETICSRCGGAGADLDAMCPVVDAPSKAEWELIRDARRTAPVTEAFLRGVGFEVDPTNAAFLRVRLPAARAPSFLAVAPADAARGECRPCLLVFADEQAAVDSPDEVVVALAWPGAVRTEADVLLLLRALKIRP